MGNKKYLLKPSRKAIKEDIVLKDEEDKVVYEAKMLKFSLLGAAPFEFINYITNTKEEHKVGKTITLEENTIDIANFFSKKSYFKFDGKKIWDYLHEKEITINTSLSDNKLGMTYKAATNGRVFATISSSSPKGKSFITTNLYYDIICDETDLDLAFLVSFAIARTEQIFYD